MTVFCHDQETLDLESFPKSTGTPVANLPYNPFRLICPGILNKYDLMVLVHSELNSEQVSWFEQNGAVAVYWWSHAMIALDWFRYAKVDPLLQAESTYHKDFLIYNRAWQGSREYRLKFAELLVEHNLHSHCQMGFNHTDGLHYSQHQFANPALSIQRHDLEKYFDYNSTSSNASAQYCAKDYRHTGIEIVLETLFDDNRWHLTEKVLRPIACAQPFVLAGTAGGLEYLRRYGFKTFAPLINESYDTVQDPVERLRAIVKVMQTIAKLPATEKTLLFQQLQSISRYNQQRFFSKEFFDQVVDEFNHNFELAAQTMKQNMTGAYLKFYLKQAARPNVELPASREDISAMLKILGRRT